MATPSLKPVAGDRHPSVEFSTRAAVDLPSLVMVVLEWVSVAWAYAGHASGTLSAAATVAIGLLGMNLTFTVWHEGIHQTLARGRRLNDVLGRLGAIPVFISYDRLRVHHLLHHRFTNEPHKDPDYWQIRGPFWALALRYFAGERESRALCRAASPSEGSSRADHVQILASLGVLAVLSWVSPWSALWAIVVPRLALCYVHAFYLNYLPHVGLPAGRHQGARMITVGRATSWLMLQHNYHALHHAFPAIPWHRYARAYPRVADELRARGITELTLRAAFPLALTLRKAPERS